MHFSAVCPDSEVVLSSLLDRDESLQETEVSSHKDIFLMIIKSFFIGFATVISCHAFAAVPQYKVNMRVGLKGAMPLSVNTAVRSGKKAFVSEISEDGQVETVVELYAKKSQVQNRHGLYMDVLVTKRVNGQQKISERAQIFAPDNQEMEFGVGQKGRSKGNLSLAVMAHQL